MLIGGELVYSESGEWLPSVNPAIEEEIGRTPAGSAADVARAVETVRSGYVWINGTSKHHRGTPFGGYGNSGIGREEHIEELLSYTETKTLHLLLD